MPVETMGQQTKWPFPLAVGGYDVDVLFQGFPGKSIHNGGLGWSTVVLLRGHGHTALIDTGTFGIRRALVEKLAARGVAPDQVTDLLLTHAHYDHIVNFTLFPKARISIGRVELDWATQSGWDTSPLPELYVKAVADYSPLRILEEGDDVLPNITTRLAPGHTPGHLIFILEGEEFNVIFLQDAVKTKAELISRETDMTYDPAVSAATVEMVWNLWRQRPGTLLVPGHDLPLALYGDQVVLLGERHAGVTAVFGDNLTDITTFPLREPGT